MEESSGEEMPDILIPPVEVNMVVGDEPVALPDDNDMTSTDEYKNEMLESGLIEADYECMRTTYKKLEDVKCIRIHCTSCDKHIGSAPNDLQNRYEHPLLKVLICGECFQFYSSGDFEKDEDGSELYCRWCGEGGQVFCCTTCPYVFCKRCIRRNLGRATAKIIDNSDNWNCFSCDPSQISTLRATYWTIQKYSAEMIRLSELTGEKDELAIDANICCSAIRKRPDVLFKLLKQPPRKRQKQSISKQPSTSKVKSTPTKEDWQPSCISQLPEDEVICTPDIMPLDDSPPHSPHSAGEILAHPPVMTHPPLIAHPPLSSPPLHPITPPPLIKLVSTPTVTPIKISTLLARPPPRPRNVSITDLQHRLKKKYNQIDLTPRLNQVRQIRPTPPPPVQNHQAILFRKSSPLIPKAAPQNNGTYKLLINPMPTVATTPKVINTKYVVSSPMTNAQAAALKTAVATTSKDNNNTQNDWFEQAVVDFSEMTRDINTKISKLCDVHTRSYKSDKVSEELYNTFQTFMDVAVDKVQKIKQVMLNNFERDMEKHFKNRIVNPFAKKQTKKRSASSSDEYIPSEDSNNSSDSYASTSTSRKRSKTNFVLTKTIEPDEMLFDMDVTNASDEEKEPSKNNKVTSPVNDDSDEEIEIIEKPEEIIQIIDSDDDEVDNADNEKESVDKTNEKHDEIKDETKEDNEVQDIDKEEEENEKSDKEEEENEKSDKDGEENEKSDKEKDKADKIKVAMTDQEKEDDIANKEMEANKNFDNDVPNVVTKELLDKIKIKFNIKDMPSLELIKYLSAVVIATNEINKEEHESDTKLSDIPGELQRNIETKLCTKIKRLMEEPVIKDTNDVETGTTNDDVDNDVSKELENKDTELNIEETENKDYEVKESESEDSELMETENNDSELTETENNDSELTETKNKDSELMETENKDTELQENETELQENETELQENENSNSSDNVEDPVEMENEIKKESVEIEKSEKISETEIANEENLPNSESTFSDEDEKVPDIEDILGSNIVMRPTTKKTSTFVDEFSKFVCKNADEGDEFPESFRETLEIARELDIIPEYVNDIYNNRDNGSLSLPPGSTPDITPNEVQMLLKQRVEEKKEEELLKQRISEEKEEELKKQKISEEKEEELKNKKISEIKEEELDKQITKDEKDKSEEVEKTNSDIVLNSEILALKQMAENCVNSVDVHKTSAECKG